MNGIDKIIARMEADTQAECADIAAQAAAEAEAILARYRAEADKLLREGEARCKVLEHEQVERLEGGSRLACRQRVLAEKQQETQKKLDEHIRVDDERNANLLRTQILRFNDELIDDKHHTREHFIETLAIIDAYEDYCRSHPNYKNNRCICAVANIKRVYNERLQKHDFS